MADDATRLYAPGRRRDRGGADDDPATPARMPRLDLVLGGLASQGVVLFAEVLAEAARLEGHRVQYWLDISEARSHGGIRAHVRIGDVPGPKIGRGAAGLLVALETGEAERLAPYLAHGGLAVIATHAWPTLEARLGQRAYPEAAGLAAALGPRTKRLATLDLRRLAAEGAAPEPPPYGAEAFVALGAVTALTTMVDRESVVRVLRQRATEAPDAAVEACLAGYRAVAGHE